jgi:polysaccharide chain length determinant protein (PEP-CTERM system associated)
VVRSFIAILMENDAGQNRNDMQKARSFIEKQIDSYEATLKAIEQRIAEFKARHLEELSSSTNGFAARQEAATKAVADRRRDLADAEARRDSLRAQIPRLSPFIEIESAPQIVVNGPVDPLQARISEMQNKLSMLRLTYTEQHPDIVAAKRSIADMLEQQKASKDAGTGGNTGKGRISNPVHEQAQMRLLDAEEAVEMARRHLIQAQQEEQRTASLAGSAPAIENEFNDLAREYGVQKKQYEELLGRRESARISEAVQNSATRVQFRVIEPPNVPVKPSGPKRLLLTSMVFGLAILGGIGTVIALNRFNDPVVSRRSVMQRSALPVLGELSLVRMAGYGFQRKVQNLKFGLAATSIALVFAGLIAFQAAKDLGIPVSELPFQLTGATTHAQ